MYARSSTHTTIIVTPTKGGNLCKTRCRNEIYALAGDEVKLPKQDRSSSTESNTLVSEKSSNIRRGHTCKQMEPQADVSCAEEHDRRVDVFSHHLVPFPRMSS